MIHDERGEAGCSGFWEEVVAGYTGLNRSFVPPPLKLSEHCGKGAGRTYRPEERKEGSEIPSSRCDVDNVVIISQQLCWPALGLHTPTRSVNSQFGIGEGPMYSYSFTLSYWIPVDSEKGYGCGQLWTHWQAYHASVRFPNLKHVMLTRPSESQTPSQSTFTCAEGACCEGGGKGGG